MKYVFSWGDNLMADLKTSAKISFWGEQSNQMQILSAEIQVVHLNACYVKVRRLRRWNIPALFKHQITWFNWEIEIMKSSCLVEESPLVVASRQFASRAWTLAEQVAGCWPFLALMGYRFQLLAIFSIFNLFASSSPVLVLLAALDTLVQNGTAARCKVTFLISAASALERRSSATFIPKIVCLTGTPPVRGLCCLVIPFLSAISVN